MQHKAKELLIMAAILSIATCYTEITEHHKHFDNLYTNDYVIVVMHNTKKNSKFTKSLKNALNVLEGSNDMKSYDVKVEYVDTIKTPFFDSHYDLEGKDEARLFIRNQMVIYENFEEELEQLNKKSSPEVEISSKLEEFVLNRIKKISTELRDMEHFKEIINEKRVVGLYTGAQNDNFDKYMLVAKKNIDFTFVHTFDPYLRESIFEEFRYAPITKDDIFVIIRHKEDLNEFDNQLVVPSNEFDEKSLTEFIEYERFDKLRNPEQGNEIVKRMFFKAQPLLLYIIGTQKESERFEIFKEAVKSLPKRFIYSYTDTESSTSGAYLQLFMMAEKMMTPEGLSILWVSPSRKIRIEPFNGEFTKQGIIDFVFSFYESHERILDSMKEHLYDKKKDGKDKMTSEEL